ncbi:glycosyltransferase family 39 protein [Methanobacterium sp. VT]|uniref:Glycosyltransferase family 39 protein n=2 Tax=Methanobacterium spitsbergense TaxID=2874285 RepID=A0A8T5UR55_9EURY|nr:glycosyltransferase family 39 protein [Methanobacterium spitsbergense]
MDFIGKKRFISCIFLILLVIIVSIITYNRVLLQIDLGPISDSVDYFTNALVFAGQGIGYSDLIRPPFFSFITSIFVRMGYVSINTIFAVDGGLFIFGVIGMFMLLKIRFNDLESFLGGLLYATFPIILVVLGLGFSDLGSVSFTIWSFYFMILAIKNDSRWFYIAFPFAMLTFLTRYNNILLIFPIFLYILMNKDRINIKNLCIGIGASFLMIIPLLLFYYEKFGNIIYPFLNFGSTSTMVSVSAENASYDSNIFFFLQNFTGLVGPSGITVLFILLSGALLILIIKIIQKNKFKNNLVERFNSLNRKNKIELIFLIILLTIFLESFSKTFYMFSELLFFVLAYLFYDLTKNLNIKNMDIHLLFLLWFLVFFIFHSIFVIKDYRYFVLMVPPVVYFMILGLSEISNRLKFMIKDYNITFPLITILLTMIILLSSASELSLIMESNNDDKVANHDMELASQWLVNYDLEYKNKNIYSDLWPNFSWYLKTNVKPVPVFKDNQVYYGGVKDKNFTQMDSKAYNKYLEANNAEYYLSVRKGLNLTSYKPIKEFGFIIIYKKI